MPNQTCSHTPSSRLTKRSRWIRVGAFALACLSGSLLLWNDARSADTTREIKEFNRVTGSSVERAQYVPGEVIVKFLDSASKATVAAAGGQMIKSFAGGEERVQLLKLNKGETVENALERYRHSPAIEYAEPNYIHQLAAIPNDAQFTSLWGLRNTGQNVSGTVGTADVDIDAPEAWDITTGSPNVIIGVIDTGIAYDHPDLAANMWRNPGEIPNDGIDNDGNGLVDDVFGYDFRSGDSDPMDPVGHGTHVAGTIGAVGNNNSGVTGVMHKVKLMALKAGDVDNNLPDDAIFQAIDYAIKKGALVINASFTREGSCSQAEYDALRDANTAGVIVLAAAGNEGVFDPKHPDRSNNDIINKFPAGYSVRTDCGSALPNVIAVAAINQKGDKASFSNFGASSVQIAAPGVNINSTNPGTPNATNDYQFLSGTSQATPHVTGVVGLLLSVNQNLTVAQIRNAILNTGDVSSELKGLVSTSRRLNAFNALNSIAPTFAVMVAKNGTGTGTVASTPAGIDCGGDCNERFPGGATVTLTATPSAGSVFTGWSGGGCSGTGTCVVSTTATVTATFNLPAPAPFTVTVNKNGTGTGTITSSPAGINCGGTCTGTYSGGTRVTLTASADAGSVFTGWNGGGCAGAGACVAATTATVTATFNVIPVIPPPITVTVNKNGSTGTGTVTSTPAGIDCGGDCIGTYPGGTTVTLTPRATAGSRFAGWSGGCSGTTTCQVASTVTVTATFNVLPPPGTFTVTVFKGGTGTGKVASAPTGIDCGATCSFNFFNNTTVTLTATADGGSTFTGWSGNGCTGTGSCVVNTAATVTATFDAPADADNSGTPSAGGGGCTIAQAGTNDALMPIMLLMTIGALIWRSRRRL
jgi:subtilisin family serine protease